MQQTLGERKSRIIRSWVRRNHHGSAVVVKRAEFDSRARAGARDARRKVV